MTDRNRDPGPNAEQFGRMLEAFLALLEGDETRALRIVTALLVEMADDRCDGCGRPFPNEAERHDALGARLGGYLGVCSRCLRERSVKPR